MNRTYTIAGVSTSNGVTKFRFANGDLKARAKVLERAEHTGIDLRDLPSPMDKASAIAFLETQGMSATRPKSGIAAAKTDATLTPAEVVATATAEATVEAGATAAAEQITVDDTADLVAMANV